MTATASGRRLCWLMGSGYLVDHLQGFLEALLHFFLQLLLPNGQIRSGGWQRWWSRRCWGWSGASLVNVTSGRPSSDSDADDDMLGSIHRLQAAKKRGFGLRRELVKRSGNFPRVGGGSSLSSSTTTELTASAPVGLRQPILAGLKEGLLRRDLRLPVVIPKALREKVIVGQCRAERYSRPNAFDRIPMSPACTVHKWLPCKLYCKLYRGSLWSMKASMWSQQEYRMIMQSCLRANARTAFSSHGTCRLETDLHNR